MVRHPGHVAEQVAGLASEGLSLAAGRLEILDMSQTTSCRGFRMMPFMVSHLVSSQPGHVGEQVAGRLHAGRLSWSHLWYLRQPEAVAGNQLQEPWRQTLLLVGVLGRAEPGAEPADRSG